MKNKKINKKSINYRNIIARFGWERKAGPHKDKKDFEKESCRKLDTNEILDNVELDDENLEEEQEEE